MDRFVHIINSCFSSLKCYILINFYVYVLYRTKNVKVIGLTEHMGDIIACLPVAESIALSDENARILWVVNSRYSDLISQVPYISKIITVSCFTAWSRLCKTNLRKFFLDLHLQNRFCAKCNLHHQKITFDEKVNSENYYNYGSLLEAFCIHSKIEIPENRQPNLNLVEAKMNASLTRYLNRPYVVIHAKSNESSRDWTAKEWQKLIHLLHYNLKFNVLEIGDKESEVSSLDCVTSLVSKKVSLRESAAIIKNAVLFFGIDSGPAHIANALSVPGVIFLGKYRNFDNYMPYTGFYEDANNALILRSNKPLSEVKFESVESKVFDFSKRFIS